MSDLIKFYLKKPLAGMNYATLGVIKPISRPSPAGLRAGTNMRPGANLNSKFLLLNISRVIL